jgi:hypothetical protein
MFTAHPARHRRAPVWLRAIAVVALTLASQLTLGSHVKAADTAPNFPRLATLYSKNGMNTDATERAIARDNLYVTDPVNWASASASAGRTIGQYLKSLNPNLIAVIYYHAMLQSDSSTDYFPASWTVNGTQYYFDLRWYLTYDGSSLASAVSAGATSLPVADLSKYAVGDRVMIGGVGNQTQPELATVSAMSGASGGGTLTVQRGIMSQGGKFPPIAHNAGDWVRTVVHAFGDGSAMILNPTSTSYVSSVNPGFGPQTWNQFLASFIHAKMAEPGFANLDGIFLDNFFDHSQAILNLANRVDLNNTNQPTGMTDSAWTPGMQDLASRVRSALPASWILMANTGGENPGTFGQYLNAGMIEGIDESGSSFEGPAASALSYYSSWLASNHMPPTFIFNGSPRVSSLTFGATDYQAMRFLLTLALTNDGYFAFDEQNINFGHQTTWWYDEYDNAGQGTGYLGQPAGPAVQPFAGVYRRDFTHGISLSNTTGSPQTIDLGGTFQKIRGTQDPAVNDGSLVNSVTLQPRDGIVLLRTSAVVTLTPTPTGTATPLPTLPPAAPSGLSGGYGNGGMSVTWTFSPGATSYNVYRGWTNGNETLYQSAVGSTSFFDTNLQPGIDYWYRITAVNSKGESSPSNEIITYTPSNFGASPTATPSPTSTAVSGPPAAPTNVTASYANGAMNVSWNASSGATAYNVQRGWVSGSRAVLQVTATGTSYRDTGADPGVRYWYSVTAANNAGQSAASSQVVAAVPAASASATTAP